MNSRDHRESAISNSNDFNQHHQVGAVYDELLNEIAFLRQENCRLWSEIQTRISNEHRSSGCEPVVGAMSQAELRTVHDTSPSDDGPNTRGIEEDDFTLRFASRGEETARPGYDMEELSRLLGVAVDQISASIAEGSELQRQQMDRQLEQIRVDLTRLQTRLNGLSGPQDELPAWYVYDMPHDKSEEHLIEVGHTVSSVPARRPKLSPSRLVLGLIWLISILMVVLIALVLYG